MSHPATTKYQADLCSLLDLSPNLAALYLSRYRSTTQAEHPTSAYCLKCGSLASTRIHKQPKRMQLYLTHNCPACGQIRKSLICPPTAPVEIQSDSKSAPPTDKSVEAIPDTVIDAVPEHPTTHTGGARAHKKKKLSLQQLLTRNREQKSSQPIELDLSAFLQQL
jgi:hypothetical protein